MLTGGKACGDVGYYIEPTIFANVKVHVIDNLIHIFYDIGLAFWFIMKKGPATQMCMHTCTWCLRGHFKN